MAETQTTTASWGVTSTGSNSNLPTGIVTDQDWGADPVLAPEYNELGQVIKQTLYDVVKTGTATIEVKSDVDLPDLEDQITIGDVTGYVKNVRLTESNQAYRKIVVTIECYSKCDEVDSLLTSS